MYEPIPSPILCGSDTVISMNWSVISSVATSSIVVDFETGCYKEKWNWSCDGDEDDNDGGCVNVYVVRNEFFSQIETFGENVFTIRRND